jgi:S1-C subfamily serine protease
MVSLHEIHQSHRKHRNVLYTLVVLLALIQIGSFVFLSIQVSKLNLKLDSEIKQSTQETKTFTQNLVDRYDTLYQENFNGITKILSEQQQDFEQKINLLKSSQSDFTSVIQDAVKSVVTVSTDSSVGTGFIVDSSGYVVTNYHVIVDNPNKIKILDYQRDSFSARLVGKDETRDLALLKIDGNFRPLELADSDELEVGQKVIAIGNPLGLSFTVTEGIISGLERAGPNGLNEYVQTDVSLNPGNSGGPLIDTQGKVVGINNFKIGGAEAIGFALESNSIRNSINAMANQTLV